MLWHLVCLSRGSTAEPQMAACSFVCGLSHFSGVRLCATPWTVDCQAPLSMGFSRQEYWSGLPFPSPEDLPDPGIKPVSLMSPAWWIFLPPAPLEQPK